MRNGEEIMELKKEIDQLVVQKSHLFNSRVQVEEEFVNAYKYIGEKNAALDAVMKEKRIGEIIVQLQQNNNILNALVYPNTPPKQIVEQKGSVEDIET